MKFHYKMPSPIGFQLAPMLDIVFLLLVFFIVTQTFEDDEPDLSINLPSAETPKPGENVSNEIIVNIRKDGTVVINRQPYTMPQLEDKLFSVARLDKTMLVRIRVDEKAESGVVVQVDGQTRCMLRPGENVLIARAEEKVRLVRLSPRRFFPLVREKLTEWSR